MQFPHLVKCLTSTELSTWNQHFAILTDRDRSIEEGIWRRTQSRVNAVQSGWEPDNGSLKRIVHYHYRYRADQESSQLLLEDFFLYYCITNPSDEVAAYERELQGLLSDSAWSIGRDSDWHIGQLRCAIRLYDKHPEDVRAGRWTPPSLKSLEAVFTSENHSPSPQVRHRSWDVLEGGMRQPDCRGCPTYIPDLSPILDLTLFQVEVGCGTSFEAGIPPLHRLHEVYRVTTRSSNRPGFQDTFVLHTHQDKLLRELISAPRDKFMEFTEMYRASIAAKPTKALNALKQLQHMGLFVGPVITNNFDVLAARAGLEECFVRRYDQQVPDVPFHPGAKALLVIGNHADRRKVQARARKRGMRIFYLDPEGFHYPNGFQPYPVEGVQNDDFVCNLTAEAGLTDLVRKASLIEV